MTINPTPSPSEVITDRLLETLGSTPSTQWNTVVEKFVADFPEHRELIDQSVELYRSLSLVETTSPPTARLIPGELLGPFRIVSYLAGGGQGEVYIAEQLPLGRLVAVKTIRRGFVSPAARLQFVKEQETLARLHHSNIVPVHFAGEDENRRLQYVAMHLVDGVSVHRIIAEILARIRQRPIPAMTTTMSIAGLMSTISTQPANNHDDHSHLSDEAPNNPTFRPTLDAVYFMDAARLIADVADALQHAHDNDVCHRDIKPSNLMIERSSGKCFVLDFGLARATNPNATIAHEPSVIQRDNWITTACGTPQYMPPEQFRGESDARSDIYSLGLVLYELISLCPAFKSGNWQNVRQQVESVAPMEPRIFVRNAPEDLVAIYRKATQKAAAFRYQTAAELAEDLRRWLRGETTLARPRMAITRLWMWAIRNPGWALACIVLGLLLFTLTAWGFERLNAERHQANEEKRIAIERAESALLERRYETALMDSERILHSSPSKPGWSREVQDKLRDILAFRPESDLRVPAVETLVGLDLIRHVQFDSHITAEQKVVGYAKVAFDPTGKRLLAGGCIFESLPPTPAAVWDGQISNKPVPSTRPGSGPVAFPDAESPLTLLPPTGEEKSLVLWNAASNKTVVELTLPGPGRVIVSALSEDAKVAAAVIHPRPRSMDNFPNPLTIIWAIDRKTSSAKKVAEWVGNAEVMALSPDGTMLAIGTEDGSVSVRTTSDGLELRQFREGDHAISGLGFGRNFRRPSGKRKEEIDTADGWLLGVGSKGSLSVWNLRTRSRMSNYYGSEYDVYSVAFSPDGTLLASSGRNNPHLWDINGRLLMRVETAIGAFPGWSQGIAFSKAGDQIAIGSAGHYMFSYGGLHLFKVDENRGIRAYRGLNGVVEKVWFSGKYLIASSQNNQVGVWHRDTGQVVYVWDLADVWTADNAAAVIDGDTFLFASGRLATRWSLKTGERLDAWTLAQGLNDTLALPPGKPPLLVRRDSQGVHSWELQAGGKLMPKPPLQGVTGRVEGIQMSADGRLLIINRLDEQDPLFYDGNTSLSLQLDFTKLLRGIEHVWVSESGRILALKERRRDDHFRTALHQIPHLELLATDTNGLKFFDDAGKLGVRSNPWNPARRWDDGIALYRVGEQRPDVTFDVGRSPVGNAYRISPDGRYVLWGRRDGTVCMADINKCLEQLVPFGKR